MLSTLSEYVDGRSTVLDRLKLHLIEYALSQLSIFLARHDVRGPACSDAAVN
jgi:hypothetical protein